MAEEDLTDEELKKIDERVEKQIQQADWWLDDSGPRNFPIEEKKEEKDKK
jgi:hypothetical protein